MASVVILARMFIPTWLDLQHLATWVGLVLALSLGYFGLAALVGRVMANAGGSRDVEGPAPVKPPLEFDRKQLDSIDDAWTRLQLDGLAMSTDVVRRRN